MCRRNTAVYHSAPAASLRGSAPGRTRHKPVNVRGEVISGSGSAVGAVVIAAAVAAYTASAMYHS